MNIGVGTHITQGGEYVVTALLKGGGFGEAFLADQLKPIKRQVVVKVPKPHIIADPGLSQRFAREAHILQNIRHPNVVGLLAFLEYRAASGAIENMALVQELVDGARNLMEYLATEPAGAASAFLQTFYALRAFQEAVSPPVIHRDMSPSNILIRDDGKVKVIDFGLSKEDTGTSTGLTAMGVWFGTPGCMSPEQVASSKMVDHRTDLFAVGRSFTAALQGRDPQHADPAALPEPWQSLCVRLTQHDPNDRFQTASEALAAAIEAFVKAGITITDFDIHLNEHRGNKLLPAWPLMCMQYFEALPKLTMKELVEASKISNDAIHAAGFDAPKLFKMFDSSEAIKIFETGYPDFEMGDYLAQLYGRLYDTLDGALKVACFARLCRVAVRLHRYFVMDQCRHVYSAESDAALKTQLFEQLKKCDPARVIESRGVFPERANH